MINFKKIIASLISKVTEISEKELVCYIEIPPNKDMGDYAFPCFKLAKTLKKAPQIIAEDIMAKIEKNENIEKIDIAGGYLNFYINKKVLVENVLSEIESTKDKYGANESGKGKNIVIDYSSPNIAKPFHIGHLRNTVIGHALYNVYSYLGYNIVSVNHLGDYGTQFGKMIEGYKRWGSEYDIENNPIDELMNIYVRINNLCKEDESVLELCRENFKKIEEGDPYCTEVWNKFKSLSLKEFNKIYDMLGVKFDSYNGEAFYSDKMDEVIDILNSKGVLVDSEGAKIVDLEDKKLGVCMLKKSNGSTSYATRDLAAILYRSRTYDFDKALYVVAYEQNLHFKQIFEVAKYLGIPEKSVNGLEHVAYGMVRLTSGKMSTREGTVIKVNDLLNEAIERVEKVIEEKNPDMEDKHDEARKIGIGAVVFNNLSTTLIKDQVFDWNTALNFTGETGPYIQYVYVRTKSVLEKAGLVPELKDINQEILLDDSSLKVISTLYNFEETLEQVVSKNEPSILARYLIELAQNYSNFYNDNKIIDDDVNVKNARVYLSKCVGDVLKLGAKLIGMEMPNKM